MSLFRRLTPLLSVALIVSMLVALIPSEAGAAAVSRSAPLFSRVTRSVGSALLTGWNMLSELDVSADAASSTEPVPEDPGLRATGSASPDHDSQVVSQSGKITLNIPKDSVSSALDIEIVEHSTFRSSGMQMLNHFELNAYVAGTTQKVTQFNKDLQLTIRHDPRELAGLDPNSLRLFYLDEATKQWQPVSSRFDQETGIDTAVITHFSHYGEQANPEIVGPGRVLASQVNIGSGTATFGYPIELPPGPGGFKPAVQLTYNSGSADEMKNKQSVGSWVGIGWDLTFGSISYNDPEGKYFMNIGGASYPIFAADGTNFQTNPDQHYKITRSGDTWEVLDPRGFYYRFGGTTDSKQYVDGLIYRYDLSLMRDTNGNEASVSYLQDIKTGSLNWVRSAYPEYLSYNDDHLEVHFSSSFDETDATDGGLRYDNPKTYGANLAPKVMDNRKLDYIEVKVDDTLVSKYSFSYTTTNRVSSTHYGGIYYSGKHKLSSITQAGADETSTLPAITFSYSDLQTYRLGSETTYVGNPGNAASFTWPHLTTVNSGYGGSVTFTYAQKASPAVTNYWTREVVTGTTINSGRGPAETHSYTYTGNPAYRGTGWDQPYRGFSQVKDTDAAGNYINHFFYTTGTVNGKDAEKLTGLEYDIQRYNNVNALLEQKESTWDWVNTSEDYAVRTMWSLPGSGNPYPADPQSTGVSSSGDVYVTEYAGNSVKQYDVFGNYVRKWGTTGSGNGQFNGPAGVEVDNSGYVYVCDTANNRVQKFTSSGTYVTKWGSAGTGDGQFNVPVDVAISPDGSYVYVSEMNGARMQKFTSSGTYVTKWGSSGSGDGQFNHPLFLTADADEYVYVSDSYNNRIQKFDASGTFVTKWGSSGSGDGQFATPMDIAVGNNGNIYVYDSGHYRIEEFTSGGTFLLAWIIPSVATGGMGASSVSLYRAFTAWSFWNAIEEYSQNWTAQLTQVDDTVGGKTSRTRYSYDAYNNVVTEYHDGDLSTNDDDATVWRTFYPNTTANILSLPARERTYATIVTSDSGGTDLKSESDYYYDGNNTSLTTPPSAGNLTRLEQSVDDSTTISSYCTYDAYGNKTSATDPNGNTTSWTLEATYNTYPATADYPISGLDESYSYEAGTGNVLTMTNVNGGDTNYQYDTFKRLIKVFKPGNDPGDDDPDIEYHYNNFGTLSSQNLETVARISATDSTWSKRYFDGIGRVSQVQSQAESSSYTIIDSTTAYNNLGSVDKQYVTQKISGSLTAYQAPDAGWKYVTYTYDGLGRVVQQTNPDGTTASHTYYDWTDRVIDMRGNATSNVSGAFGNLAQVVENADPFAFSSVWGSFGTGDGQFSAPKGVAVDSGGNVYVVDTSNRRIQKFSSSGTFITKWGTLGSGNGQFNNPTDIAIDSNDYLYVADTGNNRIQKFDTSGAYITKWGTVGTGDGQFNAPKGVGVDSGNNVYIADSNNRRIQKFNSSGSFSAKWGTYGTGDGQFNNPSDVSIDTAGYVYVADTGNNRVQKFDSSRAFVAKWGASGAGDGQFSSPVALTVDGDGYIWVADTGNRRIEKFTASGGFVGKWGSLGSGDGQFSSPSGIWFLGTNAYVGDTGNNRVQKFDTSGQIVTTYTYDTLGDLTEVEDAMSNTTSIDYDWLGRKTWMTDPDMGAWSYAYDDNGNLTSQTDARDKTIAFAYDALNRMTEKRTPDLTGTILAIYSYDDYNGTTQFGKGKRTGMADSTTASVYSYSYTYDRWGRETGESLTFGGGSTYTTDFTYDGIDRVLSVTYPTGEVVEQTYDDRGAPYSLAITSPGSTTLVSAATYNLLGQVSQIDLGNGLRTIFNYFGIDSVDGGDASSYYGKLYRIRTYDPMWSTDRQHEKYWWDASGNLTARKDVQASETETFSYDGFDRLTGVSGPYSESYAYDEIGNMTSKNGTSHSYGSGAGPHAVTTVGAYSLSYDSNGNMTGRANATGTQRLKFDVENRLEEVEGTGGGYSGSATYVYDGDGNRIKETEGNTTTLYVNKFYERKTENNTNVVTSYYYLGVKLVALKKNSTLEYIHQDSLGSSSVSTNTSGVQVSVARYLPFGATRSSTGTLGTDRKFTSQREESGTGLYFYNARYYDASLGRFISPDNFVQLSQGQPQSSVFLTVNLPPLAGAPDLKTGGLATPQALNRYSYVLNGPLIYSDPTGWWTLSFSIQISRTIFGVHVDYGMGIVADTSGNFAIYKTGGTGPGLGLGESVSLNATLTDAETIYDLTGTPSLITGGNIIDLEGITVEGIDGNNSDGSPYKGINIGYGIGAEDSIYAYPSFTENLWDW